METQAATQTEAPTVGQLTARLADNRKAQASVTHARDEHNATSRALTDKIDSATTLVTSAQQIFADDPSPVTRAKLDSARESHRKLILAKQKHLQNAPDEESIKVDLTSLQRTARKLVVKLHSHRMAKLRDEYNLLMQSVTVDLPRCVAMGYLVSGLTPGNTDAWMHLKIAIPNILGKIDSEYARLKGEIENESI